MPQGGACRSGDKLLSARILGIRGGGEEFDQIAGLRRDLEPRRRRSREQKGFEFSLASPQSGLIDLNLPKIAPNFGVFLRSHSAMCVEVDGLVGHDLTPVLAKTNKIPDFSSAAAE
jgi:hypothetical protein